jgi:hypothetical protein
MLLQGKDELMFFIGNCNKYSYITVISISMPKKSSSLLSLRSCIEILA